MVVLLPMFSKVWRAIIEGPPMVRSLFHDYSTMSGLAMANLYILMALFPVRSRHIKGLPGRASIFFAYRNVMEMEIFPETRKGVRTGPMPTCKPFSLPVAKKPQRKKVGAGGMARWQTRRGGWWHEYYERTYGSLAVFILCKSG